MKLGTRLKEVSFFQVAGTPDLFLTAEDTGVLLGATLLCVRQMASATKWTRSHVVRLPGELAARTLYPMDTLLAFAFNRWDTQCGDFRTFISDRVNRMFRDGFCSLEEWKLSKEWRVTLATKLFGAELEELLARAAPGDELLSALSVEQVAQLRAVDLALFLLAQVLELSVSEILGRVFGGEERR